MNISPLESKATFATRASRPEEFTIGCHPRGSSVSLTWSWRHILVKGGYIISNAFSTSFYRYLPVISSNLTLQVSSSFQVNFLLEHENSHWRSYLKDFSMGHRRWLNPASPKRPNLTKCMRDDINILTSTSIDNVWPIRCWKKSKQMLCCSLYT